MVDKLAIRKAILVAIQNEPIGSANMFAKMTKGLAITQDQLNSEIEYLVNNGIATKYKSFIGLDLKQKAVITGWAAVDAILNNAL